MAQPLPDEHAHVPEDHKSQEAKVFSGFTAEQFPISIDIGKTHLEVQWFSDTLVYLSIGNDKFPIKSNESKLVKRKTKDAISDVAKEILINDLDNRISRTGQFRISFADKQLNIELMGGATNTAIITPAHEKQVSPEGQPENRQKLDPKKGYSFEYSNIPDEIFLKGVRVQLSTLRDGDVITLTASIPNADVGQTIGVNTNFDGATARLIIGRVPAVTREGDVLLKVPSTSTEVSRQHVVLDLDQHGTLKITDNDSSNGTYISETDLAKAMVVTPVESPLNSADNTRREKLQRENTLAELSDSVRRFTEEAASAENDSKLNKSLQSLLYGQGSMSPITWSSTQGNEGPTVAVDFTIRRRAGNNESNEKSEKDIKAVLSSGLAERLKQFMQPALAQARPSDNGSAPSMAEAYEKVLNDLVTFAYDADHSYVMLTTAEPLNPEVVITVHAQVAIGLKE